jgi:hypothetical protein
MSSDEALEVDPLTAERIARNQSTFRDANQRIHDAALQRAFAEEAFPVICECADPSCREILMVQPDEYEEVRANARRFVTVPGHHVEAPGVSRVVGEREGYVLVEKTGRAGEVAEELAWTAEDEEAHQAE